MFNYPVDGAIYIGEGAHGYAEESGDNEPTTDYEEARRLTFYDSKGKKLTVKPGPRPGR